jgi:muramoyltetrapeptide carboxypeptidase
MISRRQLATWSALAGAATLLPANAAPRPLVKPRRLRRGDTVGLVLPASKEAAVSRFEMAEEQLEALGLRVRWGKNTRRQHGYFAGTDAERAADVNALFADPEVAAIVCYTGGWGTPRILPLLDYPVIRANPKILLGFSDITALLNGIHLETGLVTFHGPVGDVGLRPWTRAQLERVLFSAEPIGTLTNPPKEDHELVARTYRPYTIRGGKARGRLVGGNLTLLASLMGTPWEVDTRGAILLVEDIHEAPYRIDRMLTQLYLGGKLAEVAGVVFGFCTECDAEGPSFSLEEVLRDRFEPLGVPVLAGLAFGHIPQQLTLPLGLPATLDADAATLTIEEAAVV